ncbi:MAG: FG-GAP repeat protein [Myxococcales bacterium]|nr:FG-GAP repeat protein [Myxococcales bacterium]
MAYPHLTHDLWNLLRSPRWTLAVPIALALSGCGDGQGETDGPDGGPAVQDAYATLEDTPLTVEAADGVLANDDGDVVGASDAASRGGGEVALAEDGGFTYTPADGYWGRDEFTYALDDDDEQRGVVYVSVAPRLSDPDEVELHRAGVALYGRTDEDHMGFRAARVGDVNGDGLDDVLTSAPFINAGGVDTGRVYVIFGSEEPDAMTPEGAVNGDAGFVIQGVAPSQRIGQILSGAGDFNGDGLADIVFCDQQASPDPVNLPSAGRCYVALGKTTGETITTEQLEAGDGGFVIDGGEAFDRVGYSVASAGDVNGDGLDDLLIGAPFVFTDYDSFRNGAAYLVYGRADGAHVSLADVTNGQGGRVYRPSADNQRMGWSVAGLGDVNGDARDDFAVGVTYDGWDYNDVPIGRVAVYLGDGGSPAFQIISNAENDGVGASVAAAGDVNGDGRADILVGAPQGEQNTAYGVGRAFVVFGQEQAADVMLADVAQGTGGFRIGLQQAISNWNIGGVMTALGDINGDGKGDIGLGVPRAPGSDDYYEPAPGQAYVIYGKDGTDAVALERVAEGEGGFAFEGTSLGGDVGVAMAGAGDVNGDRVPDFVLTAPRIDKNATNNGAAYVIFGLGAPPLETGDASE